MNKAWSTYNILTLEGFSKILKNIKKPKTLIFGFFTKLVISFNIDVCVARNSCLHSAITNYLFFIFFFFFDLIKFISNKRFQIFFNVPIFDSAFHSRIFFAINNNFFLIFPYLNSVFFLVSFHQPNIFTALSTTPFCALLRKFNKSNSHYPQQAYRIRRR